MITITRKIQVLVDCDDKEQKNKHYNTLKEWNFILTRCANIVATHQFVIENSKDVAYLADQVKRKIIDIKKDENGILTSSTMGATYKLLSKESLDKVPSYFLSAINTNVTKNFQAEKKDYYTGKKSLRNYKRNNPMPFMKSALRLLSWDEEKNAFTFKLAGIPLKTRLGRDRSNNKIIIERILDGEYKMSDSALQFDQNKTGKWFLLLTCKFENENISLNPDKSVQAWLDPEIPIKAQCGRVKDYQIGTKEEYIYKRLQIQYALHRLQKSCKYNDGSGRKRKLQALDRFHKKEKNYMKTRMHQYSRQLIDFAIKNKAGKIQVANYEEAKENTKEDIFLLRNWGYHGLLELLKYKANKYGIKIEVH